MNRSVPSAIVVLLWGSWLSPIASAQGEGPEKRVDSVSAQVTLRKDAAPVPDQPYERYFTTDRFGREITFYLSTASADRGSLPLVAYVEGSGCASLFEDRDGRVVPAGGHIVVQEVADGVARVLIVEKPGVTFLDRPRTYEERSGSEEFRREHTLERWAEAIQAAVRAAGRVPGVQPDKVLVIGHSEGGLVACRVARSMPDVVTHVASLAGGGPSQLFDLITGARKGNFFRSVSDDPEARVAYVLDRWRDIQSDPQSTEKLFFGFAYRRWSTFLASSPMEELTGVKARIYLAQGVEDDGVDPASCDALDAHLRAKGQEVVYDRVSGANHSFRIRDRPDVDGWEELMDRVVKWFLRT
jgi:dienelactone hydrolase